MTEHEPENGSETEEEEVAAPRSVRPPVAQPQPPVAPPQPPEPPPQPDFAEQAGEAPAGVVPGRASVDLPPPPVEHSFAEQLGFPEVPPSLSPAAAPAPAPLPQVAPAAAPAPAPEEASTPVAGVGLAGPEFTAKRGTPLAEEELLRGRWEEDDQDPGRDPQPPRGPTLPAATELVVGARGAAGLGILRDRRLRKVAAGLFAVILVAAGLFLLLQKGDQGQPLALKFQPGQENRYRALMFFNGTRALPKGKQQEFSITMGATVDTKVASVDDSGATMDVTISNFALHTGTPALDVVPDVIHGQMVVGENGAVTSGGLGLSAAVASRVIPGWDLMVPILPPGTVVPDATWDSSTDVAFAGSDTVHVSADSSVSYVDGSSGRVAVVKSQMTIPVDKTISMASIAEALGVGVDQIGFPEGSDPRFAYKGQMGLNTIARVDQATGQIINTYSQGTASYTETITDWPSTFPEVPSGEIQTSVTFSVKLNRQSREQPSPATPEKSTGAKSSPEQNGAG